MPIDYSKFDAIVDSDEEATGPGQAAVPCSPTPPEVVEEKLPAPSENVRESVPAPVQGIMSSGTLKDALCNLLAQRPELASAGPKAVCEALQAQGLFAGASIPAIKRILKTLLVEGGDSALSTDKNVYSKRGHRKGGLRAGDQFHCGSSMHFLGNAAVPFGQTFGFLQQQRYVMTERQLSASDAFKQAFDQVDGATFLERHALSLCCKYNREEIPQGMASVSGTYAISECVVVENHCFIVSALPITVLERCVGLAKRVRECLRRCLRESTSGNVVGYLPDTGPEFEDLRCTDVNRVDALLFLETALNVTEGQTMIAFSEPDKELILVHRGFVATKAVREASTMEQAVHAVRPTLLKCYWCSKSAACMEEKMLQCSGCKQMDYCSESCQSQDWKAFHKHECSKLVGRTKVDIGLMETRQADLQKPGGVAPTLDLPLCRCAGGCGVQNFDCTCGSVWKGDSLRVYLVNVDLATMAVGKDTRAFPHGGFHFVSREVAHMEGSQEELQEKYLSKHKGRTKTRLSKK